MWLDHGRPLLMTRLLLWLAGVKGRACCAAGRPGAVRVLLFVLLLLLLFVLVSVLVLLLVLLSVFGVAVVVAVRVAGGVATAVAVCAGVALAVGVGGGARARPLRICQRRPTLEWPPGVCVCVAS